MEVRYPKILTGNGFSQVYHKLTLILLFSPSGFEIWKETPSKSEIYDTHFQKLHLPVQTEVSVCLVLSLFIYTKIMMVLVAQHYQECAFFRHQYKLLVIVVYSMTLLVIIVTVIDFFR